MPKSLGDVLSNPTLRSKFRNFLKEKHAVESLLFYESAELYAKIDDAKWAKSAAMDIVSKFVSPDGFCASPIHRFCRANPLSCATEDEINIPSAVREALLATKKWDKTSFDDAKAEAYKLLKANFFAAFIAREYFNDVQ